MQQTPRHKVFISYYHDEDQAYKDWFIQMMGKDIVDKSVRDGDIDDSLPTEEIYEDIRDNFIQEATVTIVLIGPCTWQRRYVDWEVGSSLRETSRNSRCGLLGILLPNYPNAGATHVSLNLLPPRVVDNVGGHDPYATIYNWSSDANEIRYWIDHAYNRRDGNPPNNSRPQYKNNRSGNYSTDWQS